MSIEANKELVLAWYDAMVGGDVEEGLSLMSDDFRYYMPGSMPVSGWRDREGFLSTLPLLAKFVVGPMTMKIGDVVAEGDRVMVECESDAPLVDGNRYQNVYVMAFRIRDGKIVELKEMCDTLHTYQVFDAPETRGEPKERQMHLEHVTRTIGGALGEPAATR